MSRIFLFTLLLMKYLIAGLGNPGPTYELTRHNIGFLVADRLADQHGISFTTDRLAWTAAFKFKGRQIFIVKPSVFMNLSGKAINYWLSTLKIPVEHLLVITDDIALPFGKLRLRSKGSHGGHNGLRNTAEILGTEMFARLRFGIGNDFPKGGQADYVLSNFLPEEMDFILPPIDQCCKAVLSFATVGIEKTMNLYNSSS